MIKASSLFYAVVISIVIAIVSSSLILFSYLHRLELDNLLLQQRLNLNAESGLNLLLSRQSLVQLDQSKFIDLYATGEDSVFLNRKPWGAFEVLISRSVFNNRQVERIAQAGSAMDSTAAFSIYLADEGKPLAVCGDTKIKGDAFLPKSGVERAYIEGQSFTGTKIIDGAIHKSKETLPEFNAELLNYTWKLLKEKKINDSDSLLQMERPFSGDSVYNSFKNNTLILFNKGVLRIENSVFSGNIVIVSDMIISVSASAVLNNIILAAPKIVFEKGFNGQLQAFASDSIVVKENVTFPYPSVLGVVPEEPSAKSAIILNENDSLSGSVFCYQKTIDSYKRVGIRMKKKSVVIGQVYSSGFVELQGSIHGNLMCSVFLLETPSSVYENHLLNATIDQPSLPSYFTGITIIKEPSCKKIVKWLE